MHIDELSVDKHCNIPVNVLKNESVASLMGKQVQSNCSDEATPSRILDQNYLIQQCIQHAVSKIKDQTNLQKTRRKIKRLLEIFTEEKGLSIAAMNQFLKMS